MFTRPESVHDATIRTALQSGWGLDVTGVEYLPAGFGSHHWVARLAGGERRFVTVDDLGKDFLGGDPPTAFEGLRRAFTVARALHVRGLEWVVGPLPGVEGCLLRWLNAHHSIAVFPYVEGTVAAEYASAAERKAVVSLLADLHRSGKPLASLARRETFQVPNRTDLAGALGSMRERWAGGPYSEPARALLREHAAKVRRILADYDDLAEQAFQDSAGWVVTHGEPHSSNVLRTREGLRVIDWDTALFGPPERDLWMLLEPGGRDPLAQVYAERTDHEVNTNLLRLYALWWDLCEIGIYLGEFRAPHADTEDSRVAWRGLRHSIEVGERWAN